MASYFRYRDEETGRFVSANVFASHSGEGITVETADAKTGKTIESQEGIDFIGIDYGDDYFDSGFEADEEDEY